MEDAGHQNRLSGSLTARRLLIYCCVVPILIAACADTGTTRDPQLAAPSNQGGHPAASNAQAYRIGPEDVLEISVLGEDILNKRTLVDPDGWITFPMAGQVLAAGRTSGELEQELTDKLKAQIRDPVVSVSLADPAGYQVYVLGKVSKPGEYAVGRRVDVLQALALAGGLTPFADQDDIKILRRNGSGTDRVFRFQYSDVKRGANLEQNIVLQTGDVVLVP